MMSPRTAYEAQRVRARRLRYMPPAMLTIDHPDPMTLRMLRGPAFDEAKFLARPWHKRENG